jgi:hypothetical protein
MTQVPEARDKVNVLLVSSTFYFLKYFVKYLLHTFPFSHMCYRGEYTAENVNIVLE